METTKSVSGKVIRLTLKQWLHIVESHDYMAGNMPKVIETVSLPGYIVKRFKGELIALKHYSKTNIKEKHCVVVYKENRDGFIITAFFTSKPETIRKRGIIWRK
ncbi:MAG: hypothetical protein AMJ89_01740 [candidate division Zixibacteria bacterium SM23_73]|nr:MAG: hypothetical protein AMJ89_01740 [candidate division Zixibacteria bacterium SM23_73]